MKIVRFNYFSHWYFTLKMKQRWWWWCDVMKYELWISWILIMTIAATTYPVTISVIWYSFCCKRISWTNFDNENRWSYLLQTTLPLSWHWVMYWDRLYCLSTAMLGFLLFWKIPATASDKTPLNNIQHNILKTSRPRILYLTMHVALSLASSSWWCEDPNDINNC